MSLQKLIQRIHEDASQEAQQIIDEAEQRADAIIQEARENVRKSVDDIHTQGEKQAVRVKDKTLAAARRRAREAKREVKEEVMQACLEQVYDQLRQLDGEAYEGVVRDSIHEGVEQFGDCVVLASRETDEAIAADLDVPVEGTIDSIGGVIIKRTDGSLQIDETFEAILERHMGDIRILMAEHLFEEEG